MPDWPEYAIWWQLHPISFSGAEPTVEPGTAPAPRLGRKPLPARLPLEWQRKKSPPNLPRSP